jgi:hypothetical protein
MWCGIFIHEWPIPPVVVVVVVVVIAIAVADSIVRRESGMSVLLRLFAECRDDRESARLGLGLCAGLSALDPQRAMAPERYWKIPELYELGYRLHPGTRATFDAVLSRTRDGWIHLGDDDDRSSVWNRVPGSVLLLPEIVWAELIYTRVSLAG